MTITNLKIDLIEKIKSIDDSQVIKEMLRVIDFELEEGIFELSSKQKDRVIEGRNQFKTGKTLPEKEANKKIQECLAK